MDDPRVIAAVIAGTVALIGSLLTVVITLLTTRRQLKVQIEQLELKKLEIEQVQQKAADDLEALRQSQYEQILSKRTEVYPKLWAIHIRFETNWVIEGKPKNRKWAFEYLSALNEFNMEGGLFFSQAVYEKFGDLRWALMKACEQTSDDELVNEELQAEIRVAVYGKEAEEGSQRRSEVELWLRLKAKSRKAASDDEFFTHLDSLGEDEVRRRIANGDYGTLGKGGEPGLSTHEKDDLGSYRPVFIQRRSGDT